jgi:hypothetical protein
VLVYPNVTAVSCTSTTPVAGTVVQCVGTLTNINTAGAWQLALTASDPSLTVPSTVTVAPATRTFQFSLSAGAVSSVTPVIVRISDAQSGVQLWAVELAISPS